MTIQWQDSDVIVTDRIGLLLNFNSPTQILINFRVIQLQFKMSDKFLEGSVIFKAYQY